MELPSPCEVRILHQSSCLPARKRSFPRTKPCHAGTLNSEFQLPQQWENAFLFLSCSVFGISLLKPELSHDLLLSLFRSVNKCLLSLKYAPSPILSKEHNKKKRKKDWPLWRENCRECYITYARWWHVLWKKYSNEGRWEFKEREMLFAWQSDVCIKKWNMGRNKEEVMEKEVTRKKEQQV